MKHLLCAVNISTLLLKCTQCIFPWIGIVWKSHAAHLYSPWKDKAVSTFFILVLALWNTIKATPFQGPEDRRRYPFLSGRCQVVWRLSQAQSRGAAAFPQKPLTTRNRRVALAKKPGIDSDTQAVHSSPSMCDARARMLTPPPESVDGVSHDNSDNSSSICAQRRIFFLITLANLRRSDYAILDFANHMLYHKTNLVAGSARCEFTSRGVWLVWRHSCVISNSIKAQPVAVDASPVS